MLRPTRSALCRAVQGVVLLMAAQLWAAQEVLTHSVWGRYLDSLFVVDQEQTEGATLAGKQIGQTLVPTGPRIDRLDLITKNRTDLSAGVVAICEWQGTPHETVAGPPLWEQSLDFSGQDAPVLRHYFPELDVIPGQTYYIRCSREVDWFYMAGVKEDRYPDGHAVIQGKAEPGMDLWFRTYTRRSKHVAPAPRPLPTMPDTVPIAPRVGIPISRQLYLDTVRDRYRTSLDGGWSRNPGKYIHWIMFYAGFLAGETGSSEWSDPVPRFLETAEAYYLKEHPKTVPTFRFVSQFAHGMRWLQEAGRLSPEGTARCRTILLAIGRRSWASRERGAMNRGAFKGFMYRILADLYPDVPEAETWRAFAQTVWDDWAPFTDTVEDSSHYNSVWLDAVLPWTRWRGEESFLGSPGMQAFAVRFRKVLTPEGAMPSWGDSLMLGADWGAWAALFETVAAQTGDRTLKWAAHQVIQHHYRTIQAADPMLAGYEDHPNLVWAYLGADDTLVPEAPTIASQVLSARHAQRLSKRERVSKGLPWYMLREETTPWKLLMCSGTGADAAYALFGLRPWGGHGHADAPALLCLSAAGTLSLHDTSYFDKRWEDHNLLYGVHFDGGELGTESDRTEVVSFGNLPGVDYADIAWQDYPGWGMRCRREVLFIHGLGWWIRDRSDATDPCKWVLGPIWHVDRIRARDDHWFDVDYPAPNSFRWPLANSDGHLLIWFAPRSGAWVDWLDFRHQVREGTPWYSSLPWAVTQVAGPLELGGASQAAFDSFLVPLAAEASARDVAIDIERSGWPETRLRIQRPDGYEWILSMDALGSKRALGDITTDARAVVVATDPDGNRQYAVFAASSLIVRGQTVHVGESRRDLTGQVP